MFINFSFPPEARHPSGGRRWQIVVIYGLAIATLLTLIVVPTMYMMLGRKMMNILSSINAHDSCVKKKLLLY